MAPTLQDVAKATACDYDFINNAVRRNLLSSALPQTTPGVARDFTRANALEIAFLSALVDVGYMPSVASVQAQLWLKKEADGTLPPWWIENRATGKGTLAKEAASNLTVEAWVDTLPDDSSAFLVSDDKTEMPGRTPPATRLACIYIAEIVRRVDALFLQSELEG